MDWFIVLAPLLLLPIAFLFVFVGCSLQDFGPMYLKVTLVWQPPLGADGLQIDVSGYVPSKAAGSHATATVPDPNEVYFGQKSRGWSLTLSADWAESKEDVPSDFEVIVCKVKVLLFDAQGHELHDPQDPQKPKVPQHDSEGTVADNGDHWCFQLEYFASSDEYSISEIACPPSP